MWLPSQACSCLGLQNLCLCCFKHACRPLLASGRMCGFTPTPPSSCTPPAHRHWAPQPSAATGAGRGSPPPRAQPPINRGNNGIGQGAGWAGNARGNAPGSPAHHRPHGGKHAWLWAMGATICPLATLATKSGPPARVHQAHWAQAPHRPCGPGQQPPALTAALGKQGGRWLARWPGPQLHGGPTGQATAGQLLHGQGHPPRGCTLHQGCRPECSRGAAKPHPPPAPGGSPVHRARHGGPRSDHKTDLPMATMGLIWGVHGAVVCTLWSDLMLAPELMGHLWGGPRAGPDRTQSVDTGSYLIWGVG